MKYPIIHITYRNKDGIVFKSYFIKTPRGNIPINIEEGVYAEVPNKLGEMLVGDLEFEI